jgi:wobble nucleotide-excising tRNase
MSLDRIQLLRNVGQFDSVNDGAHLALTRLTLIYAENGRGKTTLSAILRSASSGNAQLVEERRRLGAQHPPHVVLAPRAGPPLVFQNGAWSATLPGIVVFDDHFVAQNVCAGVEIGASHRQNLHELILEVIVLSHSKPFLCNLWEGASTVDRSAIRLVRAAAGSTFAAWDVRQDCITEHDRRHELVTGYLQAANPAIERQVAAALRPILEAFARVAYPTTFQPGGLLGPFIGICEQRVNTPMQILEPADIAELRALLDYANLFHHDSNPAWAAQAINDHALVNFAQRTLAFARR